MTTSKSPLPVEESSSHTAAAAGAALHDLNRLMRRSPPSPEPRRDLIAVEAVQFVSTLVKDTVAGAGLLATDSSGQRHPVRRALGCLVEPCENDLVQLLLADAHCWVLSVLDRPDVKAAVTLDAGMRELAINGQRVSFSGQEEVAIRTRQLRIHAEVSTQVAGERHSHIKGADTTHAAVASIHADQLLSLHANSTLITASSLLKMDGAQVHMG
jgi:hypothetical protein